MSDHPGFGTLGGNVITGPPITMAEMAAGLALATSVMRGGTGPSWDAIRRTFREHRPGCRCNIRHRMLARWRAEAMEEFERQLTRHGDLGPGFRDGAN